MILFQGPQQYIILWVMKWVEFWGPCSPPQGMGKYDVFRMSQFFRKPGKDVLRAL